MHWVFRIIAVKVREIVMISNAEAALECTNSFHCAFNSRKDVYSHAA